MAIGRCLAVKKCLMVAVRWRDGFTIGVWYVGYLC